MSHFPDDPDATYVDFAATVLLLVGAIHYFVVRSRLQADFSGVQIDTDKGWEHLNKVISTMCERTLRPNN